MELISTKTVDGKDGKPIAVHYLRASIGKKTRVLFEYGGDWRPLFWFKFLRDGSVLLAPRYKDPPVVKSMRTIARPGPNEITLSDAQEVEDPELKKGAKATLHPSGFITFLGDRMQREEFRTIAEERFMGLLTFEHPARFEVDPPRKHDLTLQYPIDDERPIAVYVYLAPEGAQTIKLQPAGTVQTNLLVLAAGLRDEHLKLDLPNLVLQLVIAHREKGPWPDLSSAGFLGADVEE
jgi:hypothetical protein